MDKRQWKHRQYHETTTMHKYHHANVTDYCHTLHHELIGTNEEQHTHTHTQQDRLTYVTVNFGRAVEDIVKKDDCSNTAVAAAVCFSCGCSWVTFL
jgi:hypothetical protein